MHFGDTSLSECFINQITIFHYISDVICTNKQTMSNPRQEGPSTGLVAAAVLFVAFAAKDLFSEDAPGTHVLLITGNVPILYLVI